LTTTTENTIMAALSRLASVADGSASPPASSAEPDAFPETFSSPQELLKHIIPLADKLEANEDTKKSRAMCLKRLVEHVAEPDKPLKLLDVLCATSAQSYCGADGPAPASMATYCKTICAFLRLVSTAQGNDTLDGMQKEILALDSLCADAEASARAEAAAPPELADFHGPAFKLFERMQNEAVRDQMSYSELALNCWLLFQIYGVATRARTLLTARWNEHITFLPGGNDVRIQLGDTDSPGKKTKHKFPLDTKLSDLQGLDDAGLLRTDIARTALSWLWNRTEFHGLVFSRADLHGTDSPFGKDRFNQAMTALTGFTDGCGKLRKRLETDACAMLEAGTITPAVRALVSSLQQHKGSTAALDYVKVSTAKVSTDKKDVKKAPADVVDKVVKEVLDDVVDKVVKEAEEAPADVVDGATQAEQPPLVRQNAVSGGEDFGGGDDDVVDGAADVSVLVPPAVDAAISSVHAEISPDEYRFVHRLRLDDPARLLKLFEAAEARARSYQGAPKHVIREFRSELYNAVRADSTVEDAEQGAEPADGDMVPVDMVEAAPDDDDDEKPAPVVAKTGDLVEITHDYSGTSNLLVTIDGESVLLELVQNPGNPGHNWTFAPHLKNSKHHLAHLVDYGVHQVCISPSPDLSAGSPMDLIVNFGPKGVELVQVGQPFEGKYYLRLAGHTDAKIVNDGDDGGGLVEKVDGLSSPETAAASDSSWLKDLAEEAEHLAYDNCRTEGDITRFQLALIKAARNKPVELSANENAAYIKYHDLGEWLKKKTEPPPGDESDSDSEYEQRSVLAELDRSIAAMVEDEAKCNHKKEVSNALCVNAKLANAWRMNPPKTVGEEESFKRYGEIADFGLERAKRLRVQ
jgi:hypothetical protein